MSPVAPWEVDEDPVNTLTQHLRQSKVECSALLEQINRKNEEVSLFRKAREDAETHARHEELRANALEEKASKALDDLKRERAVSRSLQDAFDHNKDEVAKAARSSRFLELELANAVSISQTTMLEERAVLEKRVALLERQLEEASSQPSTSASIARAEAQIRELKNEILALQCENAHLLGSAPVPSSANALLFSAPLHLQCSVHPSRSGCSLSQSVRTDDDIRGVPSETAPAPNRRRSSSLNADSGIVSLTSFATDAASLRLKVTNLERDLLAAQNHALASEQRARREREDMNHLLEVREDELAELRFLVQSSAVSGELRDQLEEKENKLRAVRGGISSLEGWLMRRVEEIEAGRNEQKQRAAARVTLSRGNSRVQARAPNRSAGRASPTSPLEQVQALESMLGGKERILGPSWKAPSFTSRPHSRDSCETSGLKSSCVEDTVPRADYDALYEQCLELEKEVEGRDMDLQAERAAASSIRGESSLLKAELQNASTARSLLQTHLETARNELRDVQTHAGGFEADLRLFYQGLAAFGAPDERTTDADLAVPRLGEMCNTKLTEMLSMMVRLRSERDDALRTLSFLEEESNSRLEAAESRRQGCAARSLKLEQDLAAMAAQLLAANEIMTNWRERSERAKVEAKRLQTFATGTAVIFQHLDSRSRLMSSELNGACALITQLREKEHRMQEDLELERTHSADLQRRLYHSQQELAEYCPEHQHILQYEEEGAEHHDDFFNVDEFEAPMPTSADSLAVDFDGMGDTQRHHRDSERGHQASDLEEPSFSEEALGHNFHPASPARTGYSDQTLASSNALGGSLQTSGRPRLHSPSDLRTSHHAGTLPDPHAGCREQLNGLEARIGRRNEQIALHQAEIARLTMNLTLAEEASAEHTAEWDKLNAERNQAVFERDAMVADCAEAREVRNVALHRSDVLEEEIDSLRTHIVTLQDRVSGSLSSPPTPPPSDYSLGQVAALVKEVIFATSRAQCLENSLAEAHEALTEACELEGHLIDLQTMRDGLAAELEAMGTQNHRITGQMAAKVKEICQMQDALTTAQSEVLTAYSQRDAARDENHGLREVYDNERQRSNVLIEELRRQLDDAQAQRELSQLRNEARHKELSDALRDTEGASLAALTRSEAAERDLYNVKTVLQQDVDLLTARCRDLDSQLQAAVELAEQKSSESLGQMRESHSRDLAALRAERDQAVLATVEAQASLKSAETATNERIASAEATVHKVTTDLRQMSVDLQNAHVVISELEHTLKTTRDDLLTRVEELQRVNGMKRFLEMDVKNREEKLAQLSRERGEARMQVEQFRERSNAAEIVNGTEKARMAKEIGELRNELELITATRDDAINRAYAAEDRSKTLAKAQRKNELQINMLKEKLRVANLQPRRDTLATEDRTMQPLVSRAASGSWRRPALLNPPGPPQRLSSLGSSNSQISLLSLAQPTGAQHHSKAPSNTPDFNNESVPTSKYYESTHDPDPNLSPAPAHVAGHTALSTGKRKREIEEDTENRRPPEAIVVPPSSPSRLRQFAERGLRTLTPKRSPRKRLAQLGDLEPPPHVPSALAPPSFDAPDSVIAGTSQVHFVPRKPPLRSSHEQVPIGRRHHPSKHRVRLHEMLATMTNIGV